MSRSLVIVGGRYDGHGRVVVETAQAAGMALAGFLDDSPQQKDINGVPWLGPVADGIQRLAPRHDMHIAIGHNGTRRSLAHEILTAGGRLGSVIHPAAHRFPSASIGEGTLVCAGAILGPAVRIGDNCIINHGVIVDHDGWVADHVNLSTGFRCGGRVRIEEGVFAGVGVVLIPDTVIAHDCYLGAGTVVIANTEANGLYVGVPARRVRTLF